MRRLLLPTSIHPSPIELFAVADAVGSRFRSDAGLVRVRPGIYAPRVQWNTLRPWDRYLARVHAFGRRHPGVIFSHESAAVLLGLPVFGEPCDIHVYDPDRSRSRRFGDVCVHTSRDRRAVECRDGLLVTSPTDTAVDLMRALPPAFALAVGDAVTSPKCGGTASVADLGNLGESQVNARGSAQLMRLLPMVDPRAESPGESVSRAVILWSGFEAPDLQMEFFTEGYHDRVDFGWRSVRALGESDGYEKYRAETNAAAVQQIMDEKRREDRLRRQCRGFARWDWAAVMRVAPLASRLDALGIPRVSPPRDALLATLSRHPRSLTTTRNRIPDGKPRAS